MRGRLVTTAFLALVFLSGQAIAAGKEQNVADIKAELSVLDGQIQQLRDELVKRGSARGLPSDPATALTRLDQLDAELRRLTDRVDVLSNDIRRIVDDATNRIGDIEFRLNEVEGGDPALVAKPETLGGGLTPPKPRPAPAGSAESVGETPLVATERADFDAAAAAAKAGDNARAATLFSDFITEYPGGPLTTEAQFHRGEALSAVGDWRAAARSFLDAFSGAPQGPFAPQALYKLGVSFGKLGQTDQACLTLAEVANRYPGSAVLSDVAAERQSLRCP